jgi:hypothetical protein
MVINCQKIHAFNHKKRRHQQKEINTVSYMFFVVLEEVTSITATVPG